LQTKIDFIDTESYFMSRRQVLNDLIERHRSLDDAIAHNRERFPSDWDGMHPYVGSFLGPDIAATALVRPEDSRYLYFDEQHDILDAIRSLHCSLEGINLLRSNIVAGPGSTSLLLALCLWLLQQGYTEIHYIPPLYYTVHYFLRMFNISAQPVSTKHVFESPVLCDLPPHKGVLLFCDPVWFAGFRVPLESMDMIARWQHATESLVIIDGSFQFMQWDRTRREHCAFLDPKLTFRLVSPTKSLAIPFFRFAYLLHPSWAHRDLVFLYENMVGGSTVGDVAFARRSLEVMASKECNFALTTYLQRTFEQLIGRGLLRTRINPDCGYFTFAVPAARLPHQVAMDQDYFELKEYPDHIRINLMFARRAYLGDLSSGPPESNPT
jgi:histidinol-phosphate/aromatic aminotransferase/cobyric acid decarboxylase-like protein